MMKKTSIALLLASVIVVVAIVANGQGTSGGGNSLGLDGLLGTVTKFVDGLTGGSGGPAGGLLSGLGDVTGLLPCFTSITDSITTGSIGNPIDLIINPVSVLLKMILCLLKTLVGGVGQKQCNPIPSITSPLKDLLGDLIEIVQIVLQMLLEMIACMANLDPTTIPCLTPTKGGGTGNTGSTIPAIPILSTLFGSGLTTDVCPNLNILKGLINGNVPPVPPVKGGTSGPVDDIGALVDCLLQKVAEIICQLINTLTCLCNVENPEIAGKCNCPVPITTGTGGGGSTNGGGTGGGK